MKYYLPGKRWFSENDTIFSKQFQAAKSINDLLDLAMLSNLSMTNALKLISSITNQINSGKSQIVDIEADERFIHLRKIVKFGNKIKTSNDDLSQYSQLSTPAMIKVNTIFILLLNIYALIYSFYKGDRIIERKRKETYTAIKDAVI